MSAVEDQAEHIRSWLKDSRTDNYTIECVDFSNVGDDGQESYSIHVIARDAAKVVVGVLAFKIKYPYLKLYPCHIKPSASNQGLTCQMYMVPMAFAAEDENIKFIVAKQVDSTLANKFGLDRTTGRLDISKPIARNGLLTIMQRLFDICKRVRHGFQSRLARAQVFAVSDDDALDLSGADSSFVQVGPSSIEKAGPYNLPLTEREVWENVKNTKRPFQNVFFDQLRNPIPPEILPQAVASIVERAAAHGRPIMVHQKSAPMVGPHLEMHGYTQTQTTQCDDRNCRRVNRICKDNHCHDQILFYKLPQLALRE